MTETAKVRMSKVKTTVVNAASFVWDIIEGPVKIIMGIAIVIGVIAILICATNMFGFYASMNYPASAFDVGDIISEKYVVIGSDNHNTLFIEDLEGNRYDTKVVYGEQYKCVNLSNIAYAVSHGTAVNHGLYVIEFDNGDTIIS